MIKRHTEMTYETFDKDGTLLTRSVTVADEEESDFNKPFGVTDETELSNARANKTVSVTL